MCSSTVFLALALAATLSAVVSVGILLSGDACDGRSSQKRRNSPEENTFADRFPQFTLVNDVFVDISEFVPQFVAEFPGDILFQSILALVITQVALYTLMA
ncbi:hypothetical protein B0T16DRAFT_399640 [Cercophora newfieldiana]|uniref:Transmembrane protein n=1 Tax=Cercophora newfieldiana TaxID=92897 RepID=A0AA39YR08_9PEZI|nr:hypothetical protein B0T16DRAFT_399640 [Cercophora newfieldiana]